jgi:DNA-binding transcriptional MerR regulator
MTAEKKKRSKARGASDPIIPDKLYFRIGEVASLCRLPAYVLRFWETEFPQLKPVKSSTGQRMYRQRDVENVLRIKKLLYDEGFTIAGARAHLKAELKPAHRQDGLPFPKPRSTDHLKKVRQGLQEILGILKKKRR